MLISLTVRDANTETGTMGKRKEPTWRVWQDLLNEVSLSVGEFTCDVFVDERPEPPMRRDHCDGQSSRKWDNNSINGREKHTNSIVPDHRHVLIPLNCRFVVHQIVGDA